MASVVDEWNVNMEDWRNDIAEKKKQKYSEINKC